jgi:hypothetical protein
VIGAAGFADNIRIRFTRMTKSLHNYLAIVKKNTGASSLDFVGIRAIWVLIR